MTSTLTAGATLRLGEELTSPGGEYSLTMQTDGNLVVRGPFRAVWASGTRGRGDHLDMQTDGNAVLRDADGNDLWTSGTRGKGNVFLSMQDDGNLVARAIVASAVWASGAHGTQYPPSLTRGHVLGTGGQLQSPDGRFLLVVQTDGNLVVRDAAGHAVWSTGTAGKSTRAILSVQTDGNVVLRDGMTGPALWATMTHDAAVLQIQADGNLVAYAVTGAQATARWSMFGAIAAARAAADPFASMGPTIAADVSYFQTALTTAYTRPWVIFRESDGDFVDPKCGVNLSAAAELVAAKRIAGFNLYHVFEPASAATQIARAKRVCAKLGSHGVPEADVESWGGKIRGDQSSGIEAFRLECEQILQSSRRFVAYGNRGDLQSLYPRRPAGVGLIVAHYGSHLENDFGVDQLGQQYTDGQTRWGVPAGLPTSSAPFGACDHQIFPNLNPRALATRFGV